MEKQWSKTRVELYLLGKRAEKFWDKLIQKTAWLLPRRLVMWAGYRIWANATQGEYGHENATATLMSDAMGRFEK